MKIDKPAYVELARCLEAMVVVLGLALLLGPWLIDPDDLSKRSAETAQSAAGMLQQGGRGQSGRQTEPQSSNEEELAGSTLESTAPESGEPAGEPIGEADPQPNADEPIVREPDPTLREGAEQELALEEAGDEEAPEAPTPRGWMNVLTNRLQP